MARFMSCPRPIWLSEFGIIKVVLGFTAKYNVHNLVYYEVHTTIFEAARREKRFKNWPRQWKVNLIEENNRVRSI